MMHNFKYVPGPQLERSVFDRSHGYKTCFNSGKLIPVFWDIMYPGDTYKVRMNAFCRLATPIKPIMDNITLKSYFFAVPFTEIWENWKEFMGEQPSPDPDFSNPERLIPYIQAPDYAAGGIPLGGMSDYLGLPTGPLHATNPGIKFNSFFHRAAHKIWNDWFRDENLQDPLVLDTDDGPDTFSDYDTLMPKGKEKDMFTSALPFPQKGPDVLLPLGTAAPVLGIGKANNGYNDTSVSVMNTLGATQVYGNAALIGETDPNEQFYVERQTIGGDSYPNIFADLTNATAATINELRLAWQIQKLYERDARGGTRYYSLIQAHFGITDPGALVLHMAQYLGGGKSFINVHPIAQTNATGATGTPQGNLAAFGTGSISGHGFSYSATQHMIVLGLVVAQADLTYQTGLERIFSLRSKTDMYWPSLAHLGEEPILSKEIYCDGSVDDEDVFGYQERFYFMRYKQSKITNLFRSSAANSLDVWHLSQDFGSTRPLLNDTFIEENVPIARVVAVPSEPEFIFDAFFDFKAIRPMPTYSIPGLVDHF